MSDQRTELDRQPEQDITPAQFASLGMGLAVSVGLIMGALLGALLGHYFLDNAFGWDRDFLVGAIAGAIIGAILGFLTVKTVTSQVRENQR